MSFVDRIGHCYELAATLVAEEGRGHSLVHGTIQNFGLPPNPHAWVIYQKNGIDRIWEPVLDRTFERAEWERFANPRPEVVYSWEETIFYMLEFGHYGPWPTGTTK